MECAAQWKLFDVACCLVVMFDNQSKILLKHKKIKPDLIRFFVSLIQQCYCLIAISEAISSTMAKFETAKDIRFSIVNCFWHLMRKTLYHLDRVNSIETNLGTNQFIIYKSVNEFWLNLPYSNGKKFFR